MIKTIVYALVAFAGISFGGAAKAGLNIEGVDIASSEEVGGVRLVLNGAAANRRNGPAVNVTSLYTLRRCGSVACLNEVDGPKRIKIHYLIEVDGGLLSKYFMKEFKATATKTEFNQLIGEVAKIGWTSGQVKKINKGDVVTIDWLPGKGLRSRINGNPVTINGDEEYVKSELMYRIMLRMNVGDHRPVDYREGLLGAGLNDH